MRDTISEYIHSPRSLYVATLVLAIAIVSGMAYVLANGIHRSTVNDPVIHAALSIRHEATMAHLGFEEVLANEFDANLDDAWMHLGRAEQYARAMLDGGTMDDERIIPLKDLQLRQEITSVLTQLRAFRNVSKQRLSGDRMDANDQIGHSFHAIYTMLTGRVNRVRDSLHQTMKHEVTVFYETQTTLIVICLILSALVARLFRRFNRGMARQLALLQERDDQLSSRTLELERNNQELEQFAYVASHDLREPLRKIQAFGDRLLTKEADNLSERGKDYVGRMHNAAVRMQALIEGLLLYSRCGTRGQPFALVDLNAVARGVISDLETRIQETGAQVNVEPLPTIHADPMQMGQLFQNMIANGIKFQQPNSSPELNVRAHIHDDDMDICFTDNGIGIAEGQENRIFGMFQRLHGRDEYEGTGVGLSICKKAAERHGGSIEVISKPGQGATFKVHLPIQPAVLETT